MKHYFIFETRRNISFIQCVCLVLSVDVMDVSGEQQFDLAHSLFKKRLTLEGVPIDETAEGLKSKVKMMGFQGGFNFPLYFCVELGDHSEEVTKALNNTLPENYCGSCYGAESTKKKNINVGRRET